MGHEARFPTTMLGAGYGFRKETIAGRRPNGEMRSLNLHHAHDPHDRVDCQRRPRPPLVVAALAFQASTLRLW